ncbi:hypothetical protein Vretifemale_11920, partial [Volvox reticuliferus]
DVMQPGAVRSSSAGGTSDGGLVGTPPGVKLSNNCNEVGPPPPPPPLPSWASLFGGVCLGSPGWWCRLLPVLPPAGSLTNTCFPASARPGTAAGTTAAAAAVAASAVLLPSGPCGERCSGAPLALTLMPPPAKRDGAWLQ